MELNETNESGKFLLNNTINTSAQSESFRYDRSFRGPLANRSCTDVFFLLLFFFFLIAFGFAGYYAQREGDLNKLLVPRDSNGYQCGQDSEVIDQKYLFFFDLSKCADPLVPLNGCKTPQVCVKECPKKTFYHDMSSCNSQGVANYKKDLICTRQVDLSLSNTCNDIDKLIVDGKCSKWYLKSESLVNLCLPLDLNDILDTIDRADIVQAIYNIQMVGSINGIGQLIVEDTINMWPLLAAGLGFAALCSLIIIAIMRWVAGPVVWLSIIGVLALLGAGIYFSWMQYDFYSKNPVERYNLQPNLKSLLNSYFVKSDTWLYIFIGVIVIFVIIFLLILVFRKRIHIAIALIKEGSKAVSSNLTTVFFPIFPWIFQAAVIFISILMFLFLASIGTHQYKITGMEKDTSCFCNGNYSRIQNGDICLPRDFNSLCHSTLNSAQQCSIASCTYTGMDAPPIVTYFKIITVVGFIWLVFFISAFSEMVLAGTFASWYWTLRKEDVPFFTLTGSIYRTIRFHLGTLAFGSLILTICRIIRLILEYIDRKLKKFDNELTKAILCCCKCFFYCLENFLKFLNRNAYIMCSIHGKNFCCSARDSFNLLMRNVLRVIALDSTTDFLFFLSKLFISLGMSACAFIYLTSDLFNQHFPNIFLHVPLAQVFFIFVGSYIIASVFFSVYSMAVDTLFLCFLEDCERNDGSPNRPYFMSKQLLNILNKANK